MVNGPLPKMTITLVALAGLGEEISNRIGAPQREVATNRGKRVRANFR
jgi:hypothetical protein